MGKSVKFTCYEDWVVSRIRKSRTKTLGTSSLLKIPKYLFDIEIEPTELDLEKRLLAMRVAGTIAVSAKRWFLRGPFVPVARRKVSA